MIEKSLEPFKTLIDKGVIKKKVSKNPKGGISVTLDF